MSRYKIDILVDFIPWSFYCVKTPAKAVETAASLPFDKLRSFAYGKTSEVFSTGQQFYI
jgi:hypothetical protein